MKNRAWIFIAIGFFLVQGCATPKIQMFTDSSDPYKEFTLEGSQTPKVLVIQANGQIDEGPSRGLLRDRPGMVPDIVSQLRLAEKDKDIGAVVIKINSPGGSVTASDVLYHELKTFKEKTGVKMVAVFMGIAASGGYYIALPADRIVAHPTTITGSVGVIFLQPKVEGLMEKLGVEVDVSKSGDKKDMGSPFRPSTAEESPPAAGSHRSTGPTLHGFVDPAPPGLTGSAGRDPHGPDFSGRGGPAARPGGPHRLCRGCHPVRQNPGRTAG